MPALRKCSANRQCPVMRRADSACLKIVGAHRWGPSTELLSVQQDNGRLLKLQFVVLREFRIHGSVNSAAVMEFRWVHAETGWGRTCVQHATKENWAHIRRANQ